MKKKCLDCEKEVATMQSLRCFDCKILLRRKRSKLNKDKYQYHKSLKHRYATYKRGADRRGLEFNLSMEDFKTLWNKECYYCNEKVNGIGIDRLNNDKGYTLDNSVVCCQICNFMKHKLNEKEFIFKCNQIADIHRL